MLVFSTHCPIITEYAFSLLFAAISPHERQPTVKKNSIEETAVAQVLLFESFVHCIAIQTQLFSDFELFYLSPVSLRRRLIMIKKYTHIQQ